jgi:hypothetical protein
MAIPHHPTMITKVRDNITKQKKRDVERAYAKMSAEEKETLKWRMANIDEAAVGAEKNMTPSLTPM